MKKEQILVTGANGQIGSVLTQELIRVYGEAQVLATDIRKDPGKQCRFEPLNVTDARNLEELIRKYGITQIYHLAAILSARGELHPKLAWEVNMNGLFNVLENARAFGIKVFYPSSIAVFGSRTPKENTPQFTIQEPETVYGISKMAGESWGQYYYRKHAVDVRSLRYPGLISYQSLPGGGTTDYAVEIFHEAVKGNPYECFLSADTRLPMMYMDDAIRATLELMTAAPEAIKVRTSYNVSGIDFTPAEVTSEILRYYPSFRISYKPDFREQIAATWPASIDDSRARADWGWEPAFDLPAMTREMIRHLEEYYQATEV